MQSDIEGTSTTEAGTEIELAGQAPTTLSGNPHDGVRYGKADSCLPRQCCVCSQEFLLTGIARMLKVFWDSQAHCVAWSQRMNSYMLVLTPLSACKHPSCPLPNLQCRHAPILGNTLQSIASSVQEVQLFLSLVDWLHTKSPYVSFVPEFIKPLCRGEGRIGDNSREERG